MGPPYLGEHSIFATQTASSVVIKFLCPNGHPLSSADDRAGKSGQCPRCQAQFIVPAAHQVVSEEVVVHDSPARAESGVSSEASRPAENDRFAFLCPNGHELHGPASLQGRPGQCPHCNSRFLIPSLHDVAPREVDAADDDATVMHELPHAEDDRPDGDEGTWEAIDGAPVAFHDDPPPPPLPVSCHPLAQIIRKLWTETRGAGLLELRLEGDQVLTARSFSAELSQHEYGVFALDAGTATTSIAVVPWQRVQQVLLKELDDLPRSVFPQPAASPRRPGPPR